ncbi:hypothetical protein BDV39DRAFT_26 [Aspergillus sergii]|uniref:Uncharacterized protein n=1 Tax=Aspergillus sergii TaxID=1034303 RepID=A0A5N6XND2_9EURO|nr:hypothetical protein BDV39DRAFT_26 [Aspergillus sergii]
MAFCFGQFYSLGIASRACFPFLKIFSSFLFFLFGCAFLLQVTASCQVSCRVHAQVSSKHVGSA